MANELANSLFLAINADASRVSLRGKMQRVRDASPLLDTSDRSVWTPLGSAGGVLMRPILFDNGYDALVIYSESAVRFPGEAGLFVTFKAVDNTLHVISGRIVIDFRKPDGQIESRSYYAGDVVTIKAGEPVSFLYYNVLVVSRQSPHIPDGDGFVFD